MADARKRVWEIQTQLYDQYGEPYIDLDWLKARTMELYRSGDIKDFALCVHDRDTYTEKDSEKALKEIEAGKKRKPIRAGELKPEHVHNVITLSNARSLSAVVKLFGGDLTERMVHYVRENEDGSPATFDDKCAYLCHERQPDKAQYEYDEIYCSFDYADLMKRYANRMIRKTKKATSRAFRDEHVNKIAAGEESIDDLISAFGYAQYEADKRHYDNAYQHYLSTVYQGEGLRLTILITGDSTVGKTPLAKFYACSMFKEIENPRSVFYCVGDDNVGLQKYRGQPVIIWDDYRAADFIKTFGRDLLFSSLFAVHPEPVDYNIKYGSVVLRHQVNIITCIDDIDTFVKELALPYTDRKGNFHKGEEKQLLQAYKRIWGLSEVSESEITFLVNKGYYTAPDAGLAYYRQYQQLAVVQNNTAALAERYGSSLYGHIGSSMLPEVSSKFEELKEKEKAKIDSLDDFNENDLPERIEGHFSKHDSEYHQMRLDELIEVEEAKAADEAAEADERRQIEDDEAVDRYLEDRQKQQDKQDERDTWAHGEDIERRITWHE